MNKQNNISGLYTQMLKVSREMLQAADGEDWDKLIKLEKDRAEIVEVLQSSDNLIPDNEGDRVVLIDLIKEIQGCDDKVRPLIEGWMAELKAMFESAGNERKLGRQYGGL